LAAVTNEYDLLFYASPGAVIVENEVLNWLKSIFGFLKKRQAVWLQEEG